MKTHGKSVKRWLSILLCCMLLLLPLGMTAGAVQEEGPETNSNLQGSGCPLRYDYTTPSLPNGYYEATYTVRAYKLLIYQTYTYTTPMVSIY